MTAALLQGQDEHLVRKSEALSPNEEMQGFKVPAGFQVQLFADETLLGGKPINMAFDARGRLWVSSTREYPYAVPKDKWSPDTTAAPGSRDSIRILEDTDGDGRADKVTVFAKDLNVPTGVLPYKNGCIAWSIPNILYLEDTDGDGQCDKRSIVLGPLGYEKDTHGMISSLRLGLDGWVYATHGFNNTSYIKAKDGSSLELHSGNTFRFKPDGSRVEIWTRGQVNPFGLCWDSMGNLYSADCHSSPIYQLIRGAFYPSFGKPHDGLGFAPVMCAHSHGSTGISGVVYLDGGVWGPEWDDHTFLGNPVTSKVNQDHVTFNGTTPKANEEPDFMTSTDPWFRPVDLHLGPDSALYVVDFYNRIIGHYEVPLDHPGRDRERGRIWRVVKEGYTGKLSDCNLAAKKAGELMQELASPNITRRYLATEELISRIGRPALQLAREEITGKTEAEDAPLVSDYDDQQIDEGGGIGIQDVHAMWVAFRLGDEAIASRIARTLMVGGTVLTGDHERLSVHCINAIAEKKTWFPGSRGFEGDHMVPNLQFDSRGRFSMRAGALAIAQHPQEYPGPPLILYPSNDDSNEARKELFLVHDSGDPALILAWRMAARALLSQPGGFQKYEDLKFPRTRHDDELAFVACSIPTSESAEWLLKYVKEKGSATPDLPAKIAHLARNLPATRESELITLVQEHFATDLDGQLDLHEAIREGQKKSGASPGDAMRAWSRQLAQKLLSSLQKETATTWTLTTPPTDTNPNPWHARMVKCEDGQNRTLLDSHPPGGEKLTGTFRSGTFELPNQISFWVVGHNGFPAAASHGKNFIRLVDAADGRELARVEPPRGDVAQQVTWKFITKSEAAEKHSVIPRGSGKVYLELTDGDTAGAYAWLAVGGFEPALPVLALPENQERRDGRIRALANLAGEQGVTRDALAFLSKLGAKDSFSAATRSALAECFVSTLPDMPYAQVASLASDSELSATVFSVLTAPKNAAEELGRAFRSLPFRAQVKLATALAGTSASAEKLLALAPARVLSDPLVSGKVKALDAPAIAKRLTEITANLPPTNEAAKGIIAARLKSFATAKSDEAHGQQVFQINCAICHRIGVTGNLVGPQLDGIGVRGVERLLEDLLDPNRAVDPAFRLHFVKQKNGNLMTGLFRREQDGVQYYADAAGQEHAISKAEITEDQVSEFSLMPAGFGELIPEKDLHDLLAYLLARK
ncbi:hypothetical protein G5S37_26060 [Roseimicrobium sp. ORNL1]|nr:hypothetical protein G5S37_26060 [Roseimicrobium sp. ORNL1]